MRTVDETSAGGLVVDDAHACAALIGRLDRRGRLLWSLPKGHIEEGETAEQAAVREVEEETGILASVRAPLGEIDYWFVAEDRRVHKTVHHYLLRAHGGELSDADVEVTEVAWVPLGELDSRLAYADERRLVRRAAEILGETQRSGARPDGEETQRSGARPDEQETQRSGARPDEQETQRSGARPDEEETQRSGARPDEGETA